MQLRRITFKAWRLAVVRRAGRVLVPFAVVLALAVSVNAASMTPAGAVADQSTLRDTTSTAGWAVTNGRELAEVITVGKGGMLSQIDFQAYRDASAPGNLLLSIRPTQSGVPTDPSTAPLYRTTVLSSQLPVTGSFTTIPVTSVDVSSANLHFDAGDQIAVSLMLDATGGGSRPWTVFTDGTSIPGSQAYTSWFQQWDTSSGAFPVRTWVAVPEPSTLALCSGLGIVGLALAWRRRKSA
jgi:hypothetical protein